MNGKEKNGIKGWREIFIFVFIETVSFPTVPNSFIICPPWTASSTETKSWLWRVVFARALNIIGSRVRMAKAGWSAWGSLISQDVTLVLTSTKALLLSVTRPTATNSGSQSPLTAIGFMDTGRL